MPCDGACEGFVVCTRDTFKKYTARQTLCGFLVVGITTSYLLFMGVAQRVLSFADSYARLLSLLTLFHHGVQLAHFLSTNLLEEGGEC